VQADWQPTANLEARQARAGMLARLREYFSNGGVLEVDTPVFSAATSPDQHVPSFEANNAGHFGYLHTSPEYPMKRLLADGSGDIYQIAKVFRAGESGPHHNPEFTLLEWYRLEFDLPAMMDDVHRVIATALNRPVEAIELSYRQACIDLGGFDPWVDNSEHLKACLVKADHSPYLPSQAALARIDGEGEDAVALRFEAYWSGLELANGFYELADSSEQLARFEAEQQAAKASGKPQRPIDTRFIAALEAGLPDCSGVAIGLDRLLMVLLQEDKIEGVINFPVRRA